ncbi:hypothetical protein LMG33818_002438 [Halomonadaceae bacterium LMG 33818]|uniref:GNAT family N-acetyltransferase n=1 Tax=Cernens ardua TaxID=3402176 RepID=UPI003EDC5844
MPIHLEKPSLTLLPAYQRALERGFSPNNLVSEETRVRELEQLRAQPERFIASIDGARNLQEARLYQRLGTGRIPGFRRWLMEGNEFIGSFGFRWVPGSEALPPTVPGHLGYAIAEWKRRRGYATAGVRLLLEEIRTSGLRYIEVSIAAGNHASIGVTTACGGVYHRCIKPSRFYPEGEEHIYRIPLF